MFACRREVRAACGGTLSRLDLREAVASLSVPTAVVAGERDKLAPPVHAQRLAEDLPDVAHQVEFERIGHMAPVEVPDAVTDVLRGLARSSGRGLATGVA